MKFGELILYARLRGLAFEQIALTRIVLCRSGEFPYRETHVLVSGGWWVDREILRARFC